MYRCRISSATTRLKVRAHDAPPPANRVANPTQNTETHQQRATPCRLAAHKSTPLLCATHSLPRKKARPARTTPDRTPPTAPPRPRASPSRGGTHEAHLALLPKDTACTALANRTQHKLRHRHTLQDAAASARILSRAHTSPPPAPCTAASSPPSLGPPAQPTMRGPPMRNRPPHGREDAARMPSHGAPDETV